MVCNVVPIKVKFTLTALKGQFKYNFERILLQFLFVENLLYSHSIPDIINQVFYQYLYRHERTTGYNQMASYYKKGSGNARME